MRSLCVVPEQPVDELQVEGGYVVSKQWSVEHDEVLGDRSVESFNERIHLGRTGIGVEVREADGGARLFEVPSELASVVCLKFVYLEGTDFNDPAEEVGGTCR